MKHSDIIDHYLEKSQETDFQISSIRKELEEKDVEEQDIKTIVRLVDDEIQSRVILKSNMAQRTKIFWVGVVFAIAGVVLNLGAWLGWINTGETKLWLYMPLVLGMGLMYLVKRKSKG